jgi:hypothetical protein
LETIELDRISKICGPKRRPARIYPVTRGILIFRIRSPAEKEARMINPIETSNRALLLISEVKPRVLSDIITDNKIKTTTVCLMGLQLIYAKSLVKK